MKKLFWFVPFALLLSAILFSCMKSSNNSCNYDPCSLVVPAAEITKVENYLASKSITDAVKHCSGMYYKIETAGTGNTPNVCGNVAVKYKGYFTSGAVFDQNATGISFNLSQLITGWKNGIPLIKAGGRIILYVPPSLAYGPNDRKDANGNVIMPGNSMLIFEIDLIAAE
jgi:FKBP-type peptidyl-prolyl cis-trans isomerase FkpA